MTKDWEGHKFEIIRLYKTENQPLKEVMRLMKKHCGFEASVRAYRSKLKDWNIEKYRKRNGSGDSSLAGSDDGAARDPSVARTDSNASTYASQPNPSYSPTHSDDQAQQYADTQPNESGMYSTSTSWAGQSQYAAPVTYPPQASAPAQYAPLPATTASYPDSRYVPMSPSGPAFSTPFHQQGASQSTNTNAMAPSYAPAPTYGQAQYATGYGDSCDRFGAQVNGQVDQQTNGQLYPHVNSEANGQTQSSSSTFTNSVDSIIEPPNPRPLKTSHKHDQRDRDRDRRHKSSK